MLTEYVDLISFLSQCCLATATLGLLRIFSSLFSSIFLLSSLLSTTSIGFGSIPSRAGSLLDLGVLVGFCLRDHLFSTGRSLALGSKFVFLVVIAIDRCIIRGHLSSGSLLALSGGLLFIRRSFICSIGSILALGFDTSFAIGFMLWLGCIFFFGFVTGLGLGILGGRRVGFLLKEGSVINCTSRGIEMRKYRRWSLRYSLSFGLAGKHAGHAGAVVRDVLAGFCQCTEMEPRR